MVIRPVVVSRETRVVSGGDSQRMVLARCTYEDEGGSDKSILYRPQITCGYEESSCALYKTRSGMVR